MKWLVIIAALAACTETHNASQVEISDRACIDCHATTLVHPEDAFPIETMGTFHSGIDCADCHVFSKGPGLDGAHADCTNCHFRADIDPPHLARGGGYMWDPTNHDFCVGCHPTGFRQTP
jgi:cytochrome c554/c'-like protein